MLHPVQETAGANFPQNRDGRESRAHQPAQERLQHNRVNFEAQAVGIGLWRREGFH